MISVNSTSRPESSPVWFLDLKQTSKANLQDRLSYLVPLYGFQLYLFYQLFSLKVVCSPKLKLLVMILKD